MVNCTACSKSLAGGWKLSCETKSSVYTGILDGYMFSSGQPNFIYVYCKSCYEKVVKFYADQTATDLYQQWCKEKEAFKQNINEQEIKFGEILKQLNDLRIVNEDLSKNNSQIEKEINEHLKEKFQLKNQIETLEKINHTQSFKIVKTDPTCFYDVILDINSLQELNQKGWKILFSEEGKKRYEKLKGEKTCVIGVVGNFNKGKSFILHKISGYLIPHGHSIQTIGLSIKYPENLDTSVTLLDAAGYETPLKFPEANEECKDGENHEFKISELARDRQLTELFLQRFVIEKSDILLIVVSNLTYSDQKLLNRLQSFCKNKKKKLFIIHNLFNFY